MLGTGTTYFDHRNCSIPHFVVTGHTEDLFCDDCLQLYGVEQALHRHLRHAGFDAVIFFDAVNSLYCFDAVSSAVLSNPESERLAPREEESERCGQISAKGPLGRRRRPAMTLDDIEHPERPHVQQPEGAVAGSGGTKTYHFPHPLVQCWAEVAAALRSSRYRVAVVLANVSALQEDFSGSVLQNLQQLGSDRKVNGVVIYLFRGSNSLQNLAASSHIGSAEWQTFYASNLLPLIVSERPEENRVIVISPPGRTEIENLLNHLRHRAEAPIAIHPMDISQVAGPIADMCASENRELKYVRDVLISHVANASGQTLDAQTILRLFGIDSVTSFEQGLAELVGREAVRDALLAIQEVPGRHMRRTSDRLAPPAAGNASGQPMGVRVSGAAGTGKAMVTRLFAHRLRDCGLLSSGHVMTRLVRDLVAGGRGDATQNVRDAVQRSLGGVLCVKGFDSLGDEDAWRTWDRVQDELLQQFRAFEGQMGLAYVGSAQQLARAARDDARLAQYLPLELELADFSAAELTEICRRKVERDQGVSLSDELDKALDDFCSEWVGTTQPWQGVHEIDHLLGELRRSASLRNDDGTQELVLDTRDVPEALQHHLEPRLESLQQAMERIKSMVGLRRVKRLLQERCQAAQWGTEERVPGCYIFHGPPGTGKTVIARRMGDMLQQLGILRRHDVVEVTAASLLRPNFPDLLDQAVARARGGVFFLDEAHQLAADEHYGEQVIQALVPIVENPQIRSDTCFILAGYTTEMERFLAVDPGLNRRFPINRRMRFDDYDAHDLTLILKLLIDEEARQGGVTYDWDEQVQDRSGITGSQYLMRTELAMRTYLERRDPDFGNGGYMRDVYLSESKTALTARLQREYVGDKSVATEEDIASVPEDIRRRLTERDLPLRHVVDAGPLSVPVKHLLNQQRTLLDDLVAKDEVRTFLDSRRRSLEGREGSQFGVTGGISMHLALAGPVGSGRHTVARAIAAEYHHMGLLDKADVRFVGKADLEAGFVGQTAIKTSEVVAHAAGGMLAVVNPSSLLARTATEHSFGPEALSVVVSAMSSHIRDMAIVFIDTQEGLDQLYASFASIRSMLAHEFHFDDFSPEELRKVFDQACASRRIVLNCEKEMVDDFFVNWVSDRGGLGEEAGSWGNGLEADRLASELTVAWDASGREPVQRDGMDWREVSTELFPDRLRRYLVRTSVVADQALNELESLIGLSSVKEFVHDIERRLRYYSGARVPPGYYTFLGNPGVGKTMVAGLMGGILKAAGVLEQGHVVTRTASAISSESSFDRSLKLARNGVLFIDEAHQLAENPWGEEVIKRLVPAVERPDIVESTCIILAGYPDRMDGLWRSDSGLTSRFGQDQSIVTFEDYTAAELLEILDHMASRANSIVQIGVPVPLKLTENFRRRSLRVFERVTQSGRSDFGNGRFVRNYLHDAVSAMLRRIEAEGVKAGDAVPNLLVETDIPASYAYLFVDGERTDEAESVPAGETRCLSASPAVSACEADGAPSSSIDPKANEV